MDISKASSLGDVGEVEGGVEITLDLPAMKAELARVQAKCSIRGLAQVILLYCGDQADNHTWYCFDWSDKMSRNSQQFQQGIARLSDKMQRHTSKMIHFCSDVQVACRNELRPERYISTASYSCRTT